MSEGRRSGVAGLCLAALLAFFAARAPALEAVLTFEPDAVYAGEGAMARVTVRGAKNPSQPVLPDVPGLQFSPAGVEQSFSYGTGGNNSSVSFRYQVVAAKEGEHIVGPFPYEADGARVEVPAAKLRVLPPAGGESGRPNLFADIRSEPPEVYLQQPFDLIISVYYRNLELGSGAQLLNFPTTGFQIGNFEQLGDQVAVIDNQRYAVRRFRASARALTAGDFKLEPGIQVGVVEPRQRRPRNNDPFNMFPDIDEMMGITRARPVQVPMAAMDLKVKNLPQEGRPQSFTGAVGTFEMEAALNPVSANVGDPLTLTVRIAGRGNFNSINPPDFPVSDAFRVYDAKLSHRTVDEQTSQGTLVFDRVVIPRDARIVEVPPVVFTYFEPVKGQYVTLTRGPFKVELKGGNGGEAAIVQGAGAAATTDSKDFIRGTDIVYLKPAPPVWARNAGAGTVFPPWSIGVYGAAGFLAAGLVWSGRRRERLRTDTVHARRMSAPRVARQALERAGAEWKAGRTAAFADALHEALEAYFGNRLNLPPGDVTADRILSAWPSGRLADEMKTRIRDLFDWCERIRYSPAAGGSQDAADGERLEQVRQLLTACERSR